MLLSVMTFDDYYSKIQHVKPKRLFVMNVQSFCTQNGITVNDYNVLKADFLNLLGTKLIHLEGVINSKIFDINANGLQQISTLRDFYHYFYYYLFFKGRALLLNRDGLDCTRHMILPERLNHIVHPQLVDPSLDWLITNFNTYYDLRTKADYLFDSSSIQKLSDPQKFNDASTIDWPDLRGLTL